MIENEEKKSENCEELEKDIEKVELLCVLKKLKRGKATGLDGIPNELMRHGGEKITEIIWKFCEECFRGEEVPEE